MGFWDIVKDQFLDVIEFEDKSNKLIVAKFRRESGNDELKQGSKVIVRESQYAVFLKGGLSGLGAGVAFGNAIAQNIQNTSRQNNPEKSRAEQLRELKSLLDDGILTQDEFDMEKKRILEK